MDFPDDILSGAELAIMRLRSLYKQFGYAPYKTSRFEEYSLYAENKAFLASGDIAAFTGPGGKLMALRPDVTLSIVKNTKDDGQLKKLYYNEYVYRPAGYEYKEQMQVGLECIGDIDTGLMCEVVMLAHRSLRALGETTRLDVSHMGFLRGQLNSVEMTSDQRGGLLRRISEKNIPELRKLCTEYRLGGSFTDRITSLASVYGALDEIIPELGRISINGETDAALRELADFQSVFSSIEPGCEIKYDFSIINDLSYYSGIIFQGYIGGIKQKVLSGGRYDDLLRKFGKNAGAIGFAVNLGLLEMHTPTDKTINIALPKGRLGEKAYSILESAGYGCPSVLEDSRRLVFDNPDNGVRYFWVKPSDVAIYVERGVADIGVAGKDTLLEYSPDVFELVDLGIGKCCMCIAAKKGFNENQGGILRVATKFPAIALDYYSKMGREIDIIKLNGSIELAPLLGLSDVIADIVETGGTLRENGLEPIETIMDISARLIANKASYKFRHGEIKELCDKVTAQLATNQFDKGSA